MHVVSDLFSKYSNTLAKTVYYAAKQAFKQLQRNKAKLSEPASINGLHNIRVYARASLLSAYTNENRGGHIYTVTGVIKFCTLETSCRSYDSRFKRIKSEITASRSSGKKV